MSDKPPQLSAEELDSFTPKCIVCGGEIPPVRARRRKYSTCSKEHSEVLRQWNKHLLHTRRCNTCMAPYTEKQRAEFRLWRRSTGQVREKAGRPAVSKENRLVLTLELTVEALRDAKDGWDQDRFAKVEELAKLAIGQPKPAPVTPEEQEMKVVDTIEQDGGMIQANVPT